MPSTRPLCVPGLLGALLALGLGGGAQHAAARPVATVLAQPAVAGGAQVASPARSRARSLRPVPTRSFGPVARRQVIGGRYATDGDMWPWLVRIHRGGMTWCGGTLVTPTVVLAAAHCMVDLDGTLAPAAEYTVIAGRRDLQDESTGEVAGVAELDPHPRFSHAGLGHDVGLLRLSRPIDRPLVTLLAPGAPIPAGTVGQVSGWGHTDRADANSASPVLKSVNLGIRSDAECLRDYPANAPDGNPPYDPSSMLCAGSGSSADATCRGDSGGPLVIPDAVHGWLQIGVVSWGPDCSADARPTVFGWVSGADISAWVVSESARLSAGAAGTPSAGPAEQLEGGPAGQVTADTAAPVLEARVGTRRARGVRVTVASDEPATVTVRIKQGGRVRAKRSYSVGVGTTRLELRGLRAGRASVSIEAADAVGNRGPRLFAKVTIR